MIRKIKKNKIFAGVVFFAVVAFICYHAHVWAFSHAAAHRAQFGIGKALGSEIMIVPIIVFLAYHAWVHVIEPLFNARIAEIYDARETLRHEATKELMILNRHNKVIRVYKRKGNKLVCIKHPHRNNIIDRVQ